MIKWIAAPIARKEMIIGGAIAAIYLGGIYALSRFNPPEEVRSGSYRGYPVEATREGRIKRVFIHPKGKPWCVSGTDYHPEREGFESVDTLFLPDDDPLRELANPLELEKAWDYVWKNGRMN
jgi:hypothetical protein